jgi:hypothetical protein
MGSNCYETCNFFYNVTNIYQQGACFFGFGDPVYRTVGNCSTSTCDWGCLWAFVYEAGDCYNICNSCGTASINSTCGNYSDVRLKTKIETIYDALEKIMKLEAVEYDWNTNLNQTQYEYFETNKRLHAIGLIAQNVRLYFPEVVSINGEGYYYIDYNKLNGVLVEAIKSQQVFIEDIKEQINELENKLS